MENELNEWFNLHKFHLDMGTYRTKDLARYVGVSPRTIQRWLKEKSKPNTEQLAKIKQYLTAHKEKRPLD